MLSRKAKAKPSGRGFLVSNIYFYIFNSLGPTNKLFVTVSHIIDVTSQQVEQPQQYPQQQHPQQQQDSQRQDRQS